MTSQDICLNPDRAATCSASFIRCRSTVCVDTALQNQLISQQLERPSAVGDQIIRYAAPPNSIMRGLKSIPENRVSISIVNASP